jgi:hypothetical protein
MSTRSQTKKRKRESEPAPVNGQPLRYYMGIGSYSKRMRTLDIGPGAALLVKPSYASVSICTTNAGATPTAEIVRSELIRRTTRDADDVNESFVVIEMTAAQAAMIKAQEDANPDTWTYSLVQ